MTAGKFQPLFKGIQRNKSRNLKHFLSRSIILIRSILWNMRRFLPKLGATKAPVPGCPLTPACLRTKWGWLEICVGLIVQQKSLALVSFSCSGSGISCTETAYNSVFQRVKIMPYSYYKFEDTQLIAVSRLVRRMSGVVATLHEASVALKWLLF